MLYPWLSSLQAQLANQYQQNHLHHALLISGETGLGKRAFAHELAAGLLCEQKTGIACGQCKSCLLLETSAHPDFFIAEDPDAKTISVDLIRKLVVKAQQKSQLSGSLVFFIPDCDKMTDASANALLKTLEEPGLRKYLILTTHSVSRLLPTILSRCQQYKIVSPEVERLREWVIEQGVNFDDFKQIYAQINRSPLSSLNFAKADYLTQRQTFLAEFKLLITGKMAAFTFSQNFNEDTYLIQLNWISDAIQQWLKSKLFQSVTLASKASKRLILSDLLILVSLARQQMLQSGVNKKIIYQNLCFSIVDKLSA